MATMDIGSPESLRRRVMELQKTLADVGVDPLPGLRQMDTDYFTVHLVTPEETVQIPINDFLD